MIYNRGTGEDKGWILAETEFNCEGLAKYEVTMALGNGYMGIRSATEEPYWKETRNTFVAGTYNKFDEVEVTELPNVADITEMQFLFNGVSFSLEQGEILSYSRSLNVRKGLLERRILWRHERTGELEIRFLRFVSMADRHVIGQKVEITPFQKNLDINIKSGINGQVTNSGVSHFSEGSKRLYEKEYLQMVQTTSESSIDIVVNSVHRISTEGDHYSRLIRIERRRIYEELDCSAKPSETIFIEKISTIHTSRDLDLELSESDLEQHSLQRIVYMKEKGFDRLLHESEQAWKKQVWDNSSIRIDSDDDFDQLAIRLAQYHLHIMTPAHDNRMSVGAKGLTGEGYKGHVFWDTEIFILPYFIFNFPATARKLLEYRFLTLGGARRKARQNGYEGAMFPWESAWMDDGEVTPTLGPADIVTGKPIKILSGFLEQHITADIAYAVWQYYEITGDWDFMNKYGYEILFETAVFWASRLEWDEDRGLYGINDVIGPDEYKEHVNNNAFTNHMAHFTIQTALLYAQQLKQECADEFRRFNEQHNLSGNMSIWREKLDQIYLPSANDDGIIPQDDSFLSKERIDIESFKNAEKVAEIFNHYNLDQINEMQICKQADVMALILLLEDRFPADIKRKNWIFYEEKTTHDSSLSLSHHSIIASDLQDKKLAYRMFGKAARIDFGEAMHSSDGGIHSASVGGIWLDVVYGFGGVRMINGNLRVEPCLPDQWKKLDFPIYWRGDRLMIEIRKDYFTVRNETKKNQLIEIYSNGGIYLLNDRTVIQYSNIITEDDDERNGNLGLIGDADYSGISIG